MAQAPTKEHTSTVVKIAGMGGLSTEFITAGATLDEAIGRGVVRDDLQKNAIYLYIAQLDMFHMDPEKEHLRHWLNLSAAVKGFNRSLASMTDVKIYTPEGAGIPMSKNTEKLLSNVYKSRGNRGRDTAPTPNEESNNNQ